LQQTGVRVKVKDSAAVVVGGASGMGRATAEQLAVRGARVAVLDLPTSDGAAVAKELGAGSSFHPCDVTDSDGVETALGAGPRRMGRPDEYAALALSIVENQMLNGSSIRLDAGQRFAPK
jgi:NAD(P)-dependent dehydrogenase (short-subunit alcohol dehydrogenase family)